MKSVRGGVANIFVLAKGGYQTHNQSLTDLANKFLAPTWVEYPLDEAQVV